MMPILRPPYTIGNIVEATVKDSNNQIKSFMSNPIDVLIVASTKLPSVWWPL